MASHHLRCIKLLDLTEKNNYSQWWRSIKIETVFGSSTWEQRGDQISGLCLANAKVFLYQVNPLSSHAWCGEKITAQKTKKLLHLSGGAIRPFSPRSYATMCVTLKSHICMTCNFLSFWTILKTFSYHYKVPVPSPCEGALEV